MAVEACSAYEIIEKREIRELNSISYLLRHKKTGAKIALLSNEDENKVFYIGFRTPPEDSTGVAHILEHSVLCGSRDFPVKDPFIELAQGSLNTFLNAMTYPDKTVYPVASCNDKDFQNLMHVYLDAVFYPNIYKEEKIFRQEGWHYQLEHPEDDLKINGVVYNEMKGAFSSPDDVLDREVFNSLFPDTPYGVESGGDPECIPGLTYENFLKFHSQYYHPSNSYIYLYGNMDMEEKLNWIDQNYLSAFDALEIDSTICEQPHFKEIVEIKKEYPVSESEPLKENAYLSCNMVIGNNLDKELYIAFQVLDYVLCSAPGAPLKEALTKKGIGKDIYSVYENGIKQPYFSIVSKNADVSQKEEFLKTIQETLTTLCRDGIDKKALRAALNYYEFKYKEADFGSYPKGLMYGLQVLDSWLYDDKLPFLHVEADQTFHELKARVGTRYFETLIDTFLIRNTHKSIVILEPARNLTEKADQALCDKLREYKATLTKDEIDRLVENTKALEEYQESPSKPEDLAKIPLLKREDMKREAEKFNNRMAYIEKIPVLHHDIFTNDICYVKLLFQLESLPEDLFEYLGIYKAVLGLMDTENYSYGDFFNEVNIHTGGMDTNIGTYVNSKDTEIYKLMFEVKCKVLEENLFHAFELMEEMIFSTKFQDEKRLYDIIAETKSRVQSGFASAGHSLAAVRAMSYFSGPAAVSEQISGLPFYRLLEKIESNFESEKANLIAKLKEIGTYIFRPENLMVDYTAPAESGRGLSGYIKELKEKCCSNPVKAGSYVPETVKKNEGLMSSSQIQFVCRAGNFRRKGLPYTGSLKVLKVIMGYEYLWTKVRVKGGAYGCMCAFGKSGDCYFVSYRDPNLKKTIDAYESAADYVKEFDADERTMTKFIIGAFSEADTPLNPYAKGSRSLGAYLSEVSYEEIQKERDEMLSTGVLDIRKLSKYIDAFMEDECICVVGNEKVIEENKEMFFTTEPLFGTEEIQEENV